MTTTIGLIVTIRPVSWYCQGVETAREKRSNGEASKERILLAATQIAGERGFHGTTMSLVSKRSGLPPSSIYWHFANKDELIAAVIERSFRRWIDVFDAPFDVPKGISDDELFRFAMQRIGGTLADFPDFLRLGLMLVLDHRPDEPTARAKFVDVRAATAARLESIYGMLFSDLATADVNQLVTLTLALSDGMFIAREVEGLDLSSAFDLTATAVLGAVDRIRNPNTRPPASRN